MATTEHAPDPASPDLDLGVQPLTCGVMWADYSSATSSHKTELVVQKAVTILPRIYILIWR